MTSLKDNNKIPSLSWSYSAGAYYRSRQAYGSLVLGGYDENIVSPEDSVTIDLNSDPYYNTLVNLVDIRSNATDNSLLPAGEITALVESTLPYIYLPEESCKAFERTFKLTWNEEFQLYLVDHNTHQSLVSSNPSITFEVGQSGDSSGRSTNITLPYAAFGRSTLHIHSLSRRYALHRTRPRLSLDSASTQSRTRRIERSPS